MSFRSGFIAIIGRPNAGKSTLLNTILGEKVAIVSEKPQTTRNRIRGVKNLEGAQIVFVDTPGIHRPKGLLNEFMVREAISSLKDVDGVVYLVEATRGIDQVEEYIIASLERLKAPVILCINKVDVVEKPRVLPLIDEYSKRYRFTEIVPISAFGPASRGAEVLPRGHSNRPARKVRRKRNYKGEGLRLYKTRDPICNGGLCRGVQGRHGKKPRKHQGRH
jgi:GTP-binding protein Era